MRILINIHSSSLEDTHSRMTVTDIFFVVILLIRVPNKHNTVYGANVVIFEGIFGLYDKKVLEMMVSLLPAN